MTKKIKVRIPAVTVELDPDDWKFTFSFDGDAAAVRKDVQEYIFNALPQIGAFGSDEVEATFSTKDRRLS